MLDVRYGEIRANVIAKLLEEKETMVGHLNDLTNTVETIPYYMEGDATTAYTNEYTEIVSDIFRKLNINLEKFAQQLEDVCAEFEKVDADVQSQLGGK